MAEALGGWGLVVSGWGGGEGGVHFEPGVVAVDDGYGETREMPFFEGRQDVLLEVGRERARV